MAKGKRSTGVSRKQSPRITEQESIWGTLDDQALLERLQAYRPVGRQGYPLRAMWRAYVASFCLNLPHTNALIRALEDDAHLRAVCGFTDLPHRRTFNRFILRLGDHADLVEACFAKVTEELRELLPDLGEKVAIDASVVRSHSNPRKGTDREATWGVGHTTQAKSSDNLKWVFGYKLHMVADAEYGVPLAQVVTTGSRHDSQELPRLIDRAKALYGWFAPNVAIADRGYDSAAIHKTLWFDHGIIPIIHIRRPSSEDPLYEGIYTKEGVPTCVGMVPMEYVGTDRKGRRVYRCRKDGCKLKDSYHGGVRHCDTTYRHDPSENLRLFGKVRRSSKRWKALYRKRQAVERVFKSLKESRRLERHCLRGLRQITLHALMSCLAFQATALVRVKGGQAPRMRWMVRAVA